MAIDYYAIRALTFDCYGTLVDWESGILGAVRPVFERRGVRTGDGEILAEYARLEAQEEAGVYKPYREVLRGVMTGLGEQFGVGDLKGDEGEAIAASLPSWQAFADTGSFLRRVAERYELAVCSNIDDDLFEATRARLGGPIHRVVTAQFCRSYKPDARHFRVALALLGLPPERVLHVAESRRHDIEPAKRLGFRTVWVDRRRGRDDARGAASASGDGDAVADLTVGSLAELARLMGLTS